MYDELVKQLRDNAEFLVKASSGCLTNSFADTMNQAAEAIEELQATLCNWCAVCPETNATFQLARFTKAAVQSRRRRYEHGRLY